MKYERFEQLPVWIAAADLAAEMFRWTSQPLFRGKGDLANQMQRAALSISNNIAEGFERGSTAELIQFLYYARGSAGEVRSMLSVIDRMPELDGLKSEVTNFQATCESISRQIRGWTNSLQNSEIKGQRHLTDDSRRDYTQRQRQRAFHGKLAELNKANEDRLRQQREQRQGD